MERKKMAGGGRRHGVRTWLLRVGTSVVIWTIVMQLTSMPQIWQPRISRSWPVYCFGRRGRDVNSTSYSVLESKNFLGDYKNSPPALIPRSKRGFFVVVMMNVHWGLVLRILIDFRGLD